MATNIFRQAIQKFLQSIKRYTTGKYLMTLSAQTVLDIIR